MTVRLRLYSDTNYSYAKDAAEEHSEAHSVDFNDSDLEIIFPQEFADQFLEFVQGLADEYFGDIYFS